MHFFLHIILSDF